jgi:hypothetical protein
MPGCSAARGRCFMPGCTAARARCFMPGCHATSMAVLNQWLFTLA